MHKEDRFDIDEIQGNIIPGFKMPYQQLAACSVTNTPAFQKWLGDAMQNFTVMEEVLLYHKERVAKAKATGVFGKQSFKVIGKKKKFWLNIAFSSAFMNKFSAKPSQMDGSFAAGLAARSPSLGDKDNEWLFGRVGKEADFLLIAASDDQDSLEAGVSGLYATLAQSSIIILYTEQGERLVNDTEHFGFKDGISQPEPRGYFDNNHTFITARIITKGNEDEGLPEFAAPGKLLIWPGQFVFGYQKQDASDFRQPIAATEEEKDLWVKNGSFLVFRRLQQDVAGFYANATELFKKLLANPAYSGWVFEDFLAKFVGRRKDGSPLLFDSPTVGQDFNNFFYKTNTPSFDLADGSKVESVNGDPISTKCPMYAHIRKVNPRDNATDQGGPTDTLSFRLLRRGIPFGPPYDFANESAPDNVKDRGLLFLSYQTSIKNQFELLITKWMNSDSAPEASGSFDMVVGQNGQPGQNRQRHCIILNTDGNTSTSISSLKDFITPTGGGYFFSPSLSTLMKMSKKPL